MLVEYKFEISAWLFQFKGKSDKYVVNQIDIKEEIISKYFFISLYINKNNRFIIFILLKNTIC